MRRRLPFVALACAALVAGCGPTPTPHVPDAPTFRLQVYVTDAAGPLTGATVYRDNVPSEQSQPIPVGSDGGVAWPPAPPAGFNVCASKPGYVTFCVPAPLDQDLVLAIPLELASVPPAPIPDIEPTAWPPAPRAALTLPPVREEQGDGFWSHDPYETSLAFDPPDGPSPYFVRGNFGPMDFPECHLSHVSGDYDDKSMSWSLPQRSAEEQVCILKGHQRRGYTHIGMYLPFSHNQGVSNDAFEDALLRIHRAGFYNVVTAFGGDGEDWARDVQPELDRFASVGALRAGDVIVVAWQANGKYSPWDLAVLTKQIADWAHAKGLKVAVHWYSGTIAWWNADDDPASPNTCYDAAQIGLSNFCNRFEYGQAMADVVDFQFQQFDPYGPIEDARPRAGGIAGELRDSLRAIYGRTKLVIAEYDAQRREDVNAPEAEGDAKCAALLDVRDGEGRAATGGFLNGCRLASGEVVH